MCILNPKKSKETYHGWLPLGKRLGQRREKRLHPAQVQAQKTKKTTATSERYHKVALKAQKVLET